MVFVSHVLSVQHKYSQMVRQLFWGDYCQLLNSKELSQRASIATKLAFFLAGRPVATCLPALPYCLLLDDDARVVTNCIHLQPSLMLHFWLHSQHLSNSKHSDSLSVFKTRRNGIRFAIITHLRKAVRSRNETIICIVSYSVHFV